MHPRITIDPNICHGKPVIKGTRIMVSLILGFLASGTSVEDILKDYPALTIEDIRAALAFGSEVTNLENLSYEIQAS